MKTSNKIPFSRCVVLINPAGTSHHRGQTFTEQLKALFTPDRLKIIETERQDYRQPDKMADKLASSLGKNSLLCIAAGDGTTNFVINRLLTSQKLIKLVDDVILLPIWGGNANDLAHMANGSARRADLSQIIRHGRKVKVHPLEITVTHHDDVRVRMAACYTSFGASAYATHRMSRPSYRHKRLYRLGVTRLGIEFGSIVRTFIRAKPFANRMEGRKRPIYDLILINGSRMAKVTRGPGNLTDRAFYELRVHRKHPIMLMYLGMILGGRSFHKLSRTQKELEIVDGTWAQIDGEVLWIPPNSTVRIKSSKKYFRLLSTKLT